MSRVRKDMDATPQKRTEGYEGPLTLGTRVVLTDSSGVRLDAEVWQEPGPNHGLAMFRMLEPNSGGWHETRYWHGEVSVV